MNTTCVLELDLDCNVRYVSHSWTELVGIARKQLLGTNISQHISGEDSDRLVFQRATEQMMGDSSSCRVRFCVCAKEGDGVESDSSEDDAKTTKRAIKPHDAPRDAGDSSKTATAATADAALSTSPETQARQDPDNRSLTSTHSLASTHSTHSGSEPCRDNLCVELEGQGVIMKGRAAEAAYTMWILKPYRQMEPLSVDIPLSLFETLGFGADVFVQYLERLQQEGVTEFADLPPPPMAMCRICERQVPTWAFESHSQLCLIEHKAESHLQQAHENLTEHREAVSALLHYSNSSTNTSGSSTPTSNPASSSVSVSASPSPPPPALYRGMPIALALGEEHTESPPRSPRQTAASLVLTKKRIFQKPTPKTPTRQIQLLMELCDTALDINGPESAIHSPNSTAKIHQVQEWPTFKKNITDPGLKLLYEDTERLTQEKVEATLRLGNIITYFGKIKEEVDTSVHLVLEETLYQLRLQQNANDGVFEDDTPEPEAGPMGADTDGSIGHGQSSLFSANYLHSDHLPHLPPPTFSQSPQESPNLMSDSFEGMPPPPVPDKEKNVTVQIGTPAPKTPSTPHVPALSLSSSHSDLRKNSTSVDSLLSVSPTKKTTMTPRSFLSDEPKPHSNNGTPVTTPMAPVPMTRRPSHISRHNIHRPSALNTNMPEFSMSDLSLSDSENRPRAPSSASSLGPAGTIPAGPATAAAAAAAAGGTVAAGGRQSNLGSPMAVPVTQRSRVHSINVEWTPLSSPLLFPYEQHHQDDPLPPTPSSVKPQQPSIKDYEIIKPISKGAFGSVYLSKKKATGEYFAIKTLKKADMIAKNQVMNVKAERAILMAQQDSAFVAKLFFTFQNRDYLFLVMEYLSGGDCAALIKMLGGLPTDWITKYMAEVVAGIEDLHGRDIVHRDLKPDNLLLDSEGHIKLTDFGLSRMGYVGRYTYKDEGASSTPASTPAELRDRSSVSSSDSRRSSNFDTIDMEHSYSLVPGYFNFPTSSGTGGSDAGLSERISQLEIDDSRPARAGSSGGGTGLLKEMRERSSSRGTTPSRLRSNSSLGSGRLLPSRQDSLPLFNVPLMDATRKFVGTPDYLAPETIDGVGQDETSDWWSLGCIMFEFIYGYPPFHAPTPEQVFDNILNRRIQWEDGGADLDDNTRDLLMGLLEPDPTRRLGYNGAAEIKAHAFFEQVTDWANVYQEEASFVPMAQSPENTDYFDSRGAQMEELSVDDNDNEDESGNDTDKDSASGSVSGHMSSSSPIVDTQPFPRKPSSSSARSDSSSSPSSHQGVRRVSSTGSASGSGNSIPVAASSTGRKVPLHIPLHVREQRRSRRLSETSDDFGNFSFKNLPVLDKANKDIINRLKAETLPIPVPKPTKTTPILDGAPSSGGSGGSGEKSGLLSAGLGLSGGLSAGLSGLSGGLSGGLSSSSATSSSSKDTSLTSGSLAPGAPSSGGSGSTQFLNKLTMSPSPRAGSGLGLTRRLSTFSDSPSTSPNARKGPSGLSAAVAGSMSSHGSHSPEDSPILAPRLRRKTSSHEESPYNSDDDRERARLRVQKRRQMSRRFSSIGSSDSNNYSSISVPMTPHFRPLFVLVCEPNPVWRYSISHILKELNCHIATVKTGSEAIRRGTSDTKFDCILTEYNLPKVNGEDVAKLIHSTSNANTTTPIVAVTSYLKAASDTALFSAVIEKPVRRDVLSDTLAKFCNWKEADE